MDMSIIQAALDRHEKVALQVSGGRDSIACLYLLRPFLHRMTVYWNNTGDTFPETLEVMRAVRAMAPNFVEIDGGQPAHVARHGIPSDIVPVSRTPLGLAGTGSNAPAIQDRYTCCANVIMLPLHQRIMDDGVTLIIRGQKNDDELKSPLRSGYTENGVELLFPIEDWTRRQVMDYLRANDAPIPRFYEMLDGAPDCMTCSAYWENGAAAYLKRYHYPHFKIVQERLNVINAAVAPHIGHFNKEVNS